MKEMKELIKEKCLWISKKENIFWLATMVVYTLLFTKTCTQLVYGAESMYQTFRDFYFYRAVSFFLIFILIERKVNLFSKPILITLVTYVGIFWRHFAVNFYEAEYKADLQAQWVAWGLFLLVMVDVLRTGKRAGFNRKNKIFCIIMSIAFMLALICDVKFSLSMVCPFLALYTTPISKKRWTQITDCFTIGYYVAFVKIMTTSLINVPYKTNIQESVFKYYGIFLNTATGGMFAAGAFICALYWLTKIILKKKHMAVGAVISLLAMIYPIFATSLFASRAAEIGILFAVLFSLIFISGKSKEKFWLKRGGIVFIIGIVAILILVGGMYAVKDLDYSAIESISNEFIRTKVAYFRDVASRMMSMTSSYSYFKDGTIWCAIDEATSYRLTTAIGGMQQVTLWGNGGMTLTVRDTFYMYPHNNYVSWMMMYGWVGGIPMVVWFIASLVTAAGAIVKKEQNCLLSFLWAAFLVVLMLTETVLWLYPAAFILLMVQYPLLVNQEETDIAETNITETDIAETVECNEVFMGDN